MQESFAFFIVGVGRLREDQFIYVETRENVFFIIWDILSSYQLNCLVIEKEALALIWGLQHFGV